MLISCIKISSPAVSRKCFPSFRIEPTLVAHVGVSRTVARRSSSSGDVDVVWQDKLSISRHIYERGSIVVFR